LTQRSSFTRNGMTVVMEGDAILYETPIGDGIERWFHANGAVKSEFPKVAGATHGLTRDWHENGQLAAEITYVAGKPIGVAKYWRPDGTVDKIMEYISENAVRCQTHNPRGRVTMVYLWNGKPISKPLWLKKLEAKGICLLEPEPR